jgi:hypothetical protein
VACDVRRSPIIRETVFVSIEIQCPKEVEPLYRGLAVTNLGRNLQEHLHDGPVDIRIEAHGDDPFIKVKASPRYTEKMLRSIILNTLGACFGSEYTIQIVDIDTSKVIFERRSFERVH